MWLTDPGLFLYSKVGGGDDVQVWRCKKTMMKNSSPLIVPMVQDDFEYVSQVKDHSDLMVDDGNILEEDWEETHYKALVKYISERRLLVNAQGLVMVEISKFSSEEEEEEDDQTTDDDADVLPIYLRSMDIPSLKAYFPKLIRERPRKVHYHLEDELKREKDENLAFAERVADAEVEIETLEAKNVNLDVTNTKLKQDLADAQAENKTLEAIGVLITLCLCILNKKWIPAIGVVLTLCFCILKIMKLKKDVAALGDKVVELESKKRTLKEKVTKLTAHLVVWKQKFTDLEYESCKTIREQEERITELNAEIVVLKSKVEELESKNKTQENMITELNADLSLKTTQLATALEDLARALYRESWMNGITPRPEWIGFQELHVLEWVKNVTPLGEPTEYTVDDGYSNVLATYWYKVKLNQDRRSFRAIVIDKYCIPNGRIKAKFNRGQCWTVKCNPEVSYVISFSDPSDTIGNQDSQG